jgi:DNA invertase Pin-like site-specific DNA recombinase
VSSKDQEREGFSIPSQQQLLRSYAAEHGYDIVEEFVDVETAKRAGRTSFGAMLAFLRSNPGCRAILVEKTDRLYRNLKDWVTLDDMDLEIHLVKEATVLCDDSRSSEKFIHGIKVLMAKNYIDNLSEETRKGMLEKARQGIFPSRAPLGYRNVQRPDGKRIIEADPDVAPQVTRLFEWYATGRYSLQALTKLAREEGLTFRRTGQPVPRATLHVILQNPLYIGEFDWDGVRYQGAHAPLVTRQVFEQVQDILHGRGRSDRTVRVHDFAFSGLVGCGLCADEGEHRQLIGSLVKQIYTYYHCERCRTLGRGKYHREAPSTWRWSRRSRG